MSPPAALREHLAAARRRGDDFEDAWELAVQDALAGLDPVDYSAWEFVLTSQRPDWQAAYERRPPASAALAVAALAA